MVRKTWDIADDGNPMRKLHCKLKRLKENLKIFNHNNFGGISFRVAKKRKELARVQVAMLTASASAELIVLENSLSLEFHDLMIAEERFFKQKSRI